MEKELADYLINILRQGTIRWKGREECFKRHSKQVFEGQYTKDGRKKLKTYWQCCTCLEWYRDKTDLEVDHIKEIGPFTGNLHEYALKMYCGQENLQTLCIICHQKKTSGYNSTRKYARKKLDDDEIPL